MKIEVGKTYKNQFGREVTIIFNYPEERGYSYVGYVKTKNNENSYVALFSVDGRSKVSCDLDLIPNTVKKKYWVNVYERGDSIFLSKPYSMKAVALSNIGNKYITTKEIEVEIEE